MSNTADDWDVEKHKTEHECDEHWELRRKFLLAHKDKFPEDELVCLAQVFTNVELLGCRYPKETMQMIAELTEDVAKEYREKQKHKLKRTFIQASDAASSKVKGLQTPTTNNTVLESASNSINTTERNSKFSNITQSSSPGSALSDQTLPGKKLKLDLPFGDMVLVERPSDVAQSIIGSAAAMSGNSVDWKYKTVNNLCECSIFINSKLLAKACEANQKAAKKEAAVKGLSELQKYYYTIKVKQKLNEEANITATSMSSKESISTSSEQFDMEDNIGKKLMKLMGWAGGGLGKSQQGITEPVTMHQQINRRGLGLTRSPQDGSKVNGSKGNSVATNKLKNMCREKFREFRKGDMKKDLVFSSDFSNEERAVIHQVAREMGLKSHSYGPKTQRTLVISRKIDVKDLVEELKSLGGVTDKYELIEPRP